MKSSMFRLITGQSCCADFKWEKVHFGEVLKIPFSADGEKALEGPQSKV